MEGTLGSVESVGISVAWPTIMVRPKEISQREWNVRADAPTGQVEKAVPK